MKNCFVFLVFFVPLGGCGQNTSDIDGVWRGEHPTTVQLEMRLSETAGTVMGTGTYSISGPRPTGTFRVEGSFSNPSITLRFAYDSGTHSTFDGALEASSRMVGHISYTNRTGQTQSDPVTLYKSTQ